MRKITLFLMSLFLTVGAMAQMPAGYFAGSEVTFTNIQKDGTTKYTLYINESNELALSTSSAEELGGAAKFFCEKRANNKYSFYNREKELYLIWRGKGAGYNSDEGVLDEYNATYCDWTINAGAVISETQTYFFVGKRSNGTNDGTLVVMKSNGVFDAWGNTQALSDTYSNLYDIQVVNREYVADASAFENGKIYTFVTARGWMGAKDGNNNVISTAKTSHNLTGDKASPNFQWAVFQSENGNYYLYNIGKGMFMGVQASNNASVPFVASPTGKNLTFKVSSNLEYPIMFSTNNAAVVNHSTSYGDGCISWTGGWGTLNDTGSNHKVEVVGNVADEVLAKIEKLVAAREIGYFRLKGISGNYIDASSIYNNATAKTGQMSMKSDADCNLAGTIFYFDDDSRFLNYATGTYTKDTREIGAINDGTKSVWTVGISSRDSEKFELTDISTTGSKNLHDNSGNRADKCSSVCGNRHDFTLEKVEALPVTISAAKYATFYAPVAVKVASGVTAYTVTVDAVNNRVELNEIDGVIPANTGVVLYSETAGTYDFAITEDVEAIEGNALRGSAAATYYTTAGTYYALGLVDGKVGFYKDAFNNGRFQNNSHKAYLYVANASNAASYSFRFPGTTGVEEVVVENEVNAIYDLTGRRVSEITEAGIYIVNGKKVLVK
ncbi:MAG: hypothetical protein IKY85_05675 [Bacteroidaceae bacterium]|nr:hypothetical protein [Bacteroidaceae bacterium]